MSCGALFWTDIFSFCFSLLRSQLEFNNKVSIACFRNNFIAVLNQIFWMNDLRLHLILSDGNNWRIAVCPCERVSMGNGGDEDRYMFIYSTHSSFYCKHSRSETNKPEAAHTRQRTYRPILYFFHPNHYLPKEHNLISIRSFVVTLR